MLGPDRYMFSSAGLFLPRKIHSATVAETLWHGTGKQPRGAACVELERLGVAGRRSIEDVRNRRAA